MSEQPLTRRQLRERARAAEAAPPAALTRRELRAQRMAAEAEAGVVAELAAGSAVSASSAPSSPAAERSAPEPRTPPEPQRTVRRRPVLAPPTTGNTPVIDPQTGAIAAVTINIPPAPEDPPAPPAAETASRSSADSPAAPTPEPAPEAIPGPVPPRRPMAPPAPAAAVPEVPAPAPADESSTEDPERPSIAGSDESAPARVAEAYLEAASGDPAVREWSSPSFDDVLEGADGADGLGVEPRWRPVPDEPATGSAAPSGDNPARASLFGKIAEGGVAADVDNEDESAELTVEQVSLGRERKAFTVLRYVFLVIAMFVVGGLIWLLADRASAATPSAGAVLSHGPAPDETVSAEY